MGDAKELEQELLTLTLTLVLVLVLVLAAFTIGVIVLATDRHVSWSA